MIRGLMWMLSDEHTTRVSVNGRKKKQRECPYCGGLMIKTAGDGVIFICEHCGHDEHEKPSKKEW